MGCAGRTSGRPPWRSESASLLRRAVAGDGGRSTGGHAHHIHRCSGESSALEGAFSADIIANLDIGKRDGIAALAEGSVFVGYKRMRSVICRAHERDLHAGYGRHLAHDPGFAVVGVHLLPLPGTVGVNLRNHHRAHRFGRGIHFAHGTNGIADLDVGGFDLLRRIASPAHAAAHALAASSLSRTHALTAASSFTTTAGTAHA